MRIIKTILLTMLIGLLSTYALADTHEADSCSQAHVADAVNAASDGDTVTIPAGPPCTWTTITAGQPCVDLTNKNLAIIGAGIDQTIITDATNSGWKEEPIWSQKPCRITGITFNGHSTGHGAIFVYGIAATDFRIDHCKFDDLDGLSIKVWEAYGLIDHCTFNVTADASISSMFIYGRDTVSWATAASWGTGDAVFIENCAFNYSYLNDSTSQGHRGARIVFRYNTVVGAAVDMHEGCSNGYNGSFSLEMYNNAFSATGNAPWALYLRNGSARVFNNTVTGTYQRVVAMTDFWTCEDATHSLCTGLWETRCTTYPCTNQVGRGTNQALSPVYIWGNSVVGDVMGYVHTEGVLSCTSPSVTDHIQEDREYYIEGVAEAGGVYSHAGTGMTYTPFTYPHPLVGSEGGEPEPLPPPVNPALNVNTKLPPIYSP